MINWNFQRKQMRENMRKNMNASEEVIITNSRTKIKVTAGRTIPFRLTTQLEARAMIALSWSKAALWRSASVCSAIWSVRISSTFCWARKPRSARANSRSVCIWANFNSWALSALSWKKFRICGKPEARNPTAEDIRDSITGVL